MPKMNVRHHAVHPPSTVRPNLAVNQKPNYTPLETASTPNVSPSLPGPVGVDAANMRLNTINLADDSDDDCDPADDSDCDEEDRTTIPIHN